MHMSKENWLLKILRNIAIEEGEPKQISGKQELFETLISDYI